MNEQYDISVLMSVYNTNESWLRESIESILKQSYPNFEFIIVLDCPTDKSEDIVREYAEKDQRIIVLKNTSNIGLTKSLNKALALAKGQFIARMDADDISVVTRFEKQIAYLRANPDVAVVGARSYLTVSHKPIINDWTEDQEVLAIRMMFRNAGLPHPSAMIRKSVLDEHNIRYTESVKKSQDYKLWTDILPYGKLMVLPEIMLIYREHENQISANTTSINQYASAISLMQAEKLLGEMSDKEKKLHLSVSAGDLSREEIKDLKKYFDRIVAANLEKHCYHHEKLKRELNYLWCRKAIRRLIIQKKPDMCFSLKMLNCLNPSFLRYIHENTQRNREYIQAIEAFDLTKELKG